MASYVASVLAICATLFVDIEITPLCLRLVGGGTLAGLPHFAIYIL
jgi:hypothetical protein